MQINMYVERERPLNLNTTVLFIGNNLFSTEEILVTINVDIYLFSFDLNTNFSENHANFLCFFEDETKQLLYDFIFNL